MKLTDFECPYCYETVDIEIDDYDDEGFCPSCGEQVYPKEETRQRIVYVEDNRTTKHDAKVMAIVMGMLVLIMVFALAMSAFFTHQSEQAASSAQAAGKISAGSASDYEKEKLDAVVAQLEALGFKNIETIDLDDSGLAFWNNGKVASISINGDDSFSSNDYFFPTDKVIITYH